MSLRSLVKSLDHRAIVVVAAVALLGCGSKTEPAPAAPADATQIDLTDNAEIERVALESAKAYREKNLERLAELAPPSAKQALIFIEPRNPHYAELLGDDTWRMKALRAWDGQKLMKVERGPDVAFGYFWQDETQRYAIEVRKDNGRWQFHDMVKKPLPAKAP